MPRSPVDEFRLLPWGRALQEQWQEVLELLLDSGWQPEDLLRKSVGRVCE